MKRQVGTLPQAERYCPSTGEHGPHLGASMTRPIRPARFRATPQAGGSCPRRRYLKQQRLAPCRRFQKVHRPRPQKASGAPPLTADDPHLGRPWSGQNDWLSMFGEISLVWDKGPVVASSRRRNPRAPHGERSGLERLTSADRPCLVQVVRQVGLQVIHDSSLCRILA